MRTWILALLMLTGCAGDKDSTPVDTGPFDADADGFPAAVDCNDGDPSIYPEATERCDGKDNNCDTDIDGDATDADLWFADTDADGYGDPESSVAACERPTGYVSTSDDCNDADLNIHPGAPESCEVDLDSNCDGSVAYADADADGVVACLDCDDADAAVTSTLYYLDEDGDGYGVTELTHADCFLPEGYAAVGGDCDDFNDDVNPGIVEDDCADFTDYSCDGVVTRPDLDGDGANVCDDCDDENANVAPGLAEVCDDQDNDCDGEEDEDAIDPASWYLDNDGDGFGNDVGATVACDQPRGTVAIAGDCDDSEDLVYPGASELDCTDPTDYNCDGSVGYADADGDGFPACEECDDTNAAANPDMVEVCNSIDDDCDGTIDEDDAEDAGIWYLDLDGDSFGDVTVAVAACAAPVGYTALEGDCDDTTSSTNPDADEVCDGVDNDCTGEIDESWALDAQTWYADDDGDGFGDPAVTELACPASDGSGPEGTVADDTDCDDADASAAPGAPEQCDAVDNDCDGVVDDGASDASAWYADTDADGFGDPLAVSLSCAAPVGSVPDATDCDDTRDDVWPGADETCDNLDNDCDGLVDDDALDALDWFADDDTDGFGDPDSVTSACDAPAGAVADNTDCDDTRDDVWPGAEEVCDDADNDCDGDDDEEALDALTWYDDLDNDGYGDASAPTLSCEAPAGTVADAADCDDNNTSISPAGTERCNGLDDDCDGTADDGSSLDPASWYGDADGDGFGDPSDVVSSCSPPTGYVANDLDCDPTDATVYPGASEQCNGVDDDCDGALDEDSADDAASWYTDADADGYGDPGEVVVSCAAPAGTSSDNTDCDDGDATINPAATELCDDVDNDCDGRTDIGADDAVTLHIDADGDGQGDPNSGSNGCDGTFGYAANNDDCDDTNANIYTGADELCNNIDDDCDGTVDGDNALDVVNYFLDNDDDGYGLDSAPELACEEPPGFATFGGDCDDGDEAVNPGAPEVCDDGIDNNCDQSFSGCGWVGRSTAVVADATWTGYAAREFFGHAIDGAGDFDGDGFDDILAGAYAADINATGSGRAYVISGPGLTTTLTAAELTLDGAYLSDGLGRAVSGLGDVNGDGYDDVLVGAEGVNTGIFANAGAAYLLTGPMTGTAQTHDATAAYFGEGGSDLAGSTVGGPGDVDGDGLDDLAIAATGWDPGGAVAVVSGGVFVNLSLSFANTLITGVDPNDDLGSGIGSHGDLDGDGLDDLILGAPGRYLGGANTGAVVVFYSPLPSTDTLVNADVTLVGDDPGDGFGTTVAVAGDLDDDGSVDIVVGAPYLDGAETDVGRAWAFDGPYGVNMTTANAVLTVTGIEGSDRVGESVDGAGDVNADGFDDLLIAGGGVDQTSANEGAAGLLYGPVSGTVDLINADGVIFGIERIDNLNRVAGAGDVDADGYADFLLAASTADIGGVSTGSVYLFLGSGL